jgi:hypothetical protein
MKNICKKISAALRWVFGYSIMFCLFAGGLTFFGYMVALCVVGDTAAAICNVIYKTIVPVIIKVTSVTVLLGLVVMYLNGEVALSAGKKK